MGASGRLGPRRNAGLACRTLANFLLPGLTLGSQLFDGASRLVLGLGQFPLPTANLLLGRAKPGRQAPPHVLERTLPEHGRYVAHDLSPQLFGGQAGFESLAVQLFQFLGQGVELRLALGQLRLLIVERRALLGPLGLELFAPQGLVPLELDLLGGQSGPVDGQLLLGRGQRGRLGPQPNRKIVQGSLALGKLGRPVLELPMVGLGLLGGLAAKLLQPAPLRFHRRLATFQPGVELPHQLQRRGPAGIDPLPFGGQLIFLALSLLDQAALGLFQRGALQLGSLRRRIELARAAIELDLALGELLLTLIGKLPGLVLGLGKLRPAGGQGPLALVERLAPLVEFVMALGHPEPCGPGFVLDFRDLGVVAGIAPVELLLALPEKGGKLLGLGFQPLTLGFPIAGWVGGWGARGFQRHSGRGGRSHRGMVSLTGQGAHLAALKPRGVRSIDPGLDADQFGRQRGRSRCQRSAHRLRHTPRRFCAIGKVCAGLCIGTRAAIY